MVDTVYDKINDYGSVSIKLASAEDIHSWSFGEVKKPETINYRTYKPEKDGLFCEKIFGPERNWECHCGKYKGKKYKGTVCDRCSVLIAHSSVRRKRMGHINLAAPVAHIWFFKVQPSKIGNLLNVKVSDVERIVYYQEYIVIDPGDTPLEAGQLLNDEEYRQAREDYGDAFEAGMGAESIRKLLVGLDLDSLTKELRVALKESKSVQKTRDIIKRLELAELMKDSGNEPEWMVLDVIPVIPPNLRPIVHLDSGNFATSDLNDLYRRLINRNNRLKKLLEMNAPEIIIRNEKRLIQQAVDALFDNGRCRRVVLGAANRPLKSLTDMIKGKQGRFRENLLGKRVDYSARSVIVVGPELKLHQCGLPKKIALELFQPFIIRRLKELGYADTIKSAKKMLERKDEEVWDILEEVTKDHPVLLNRAPTLHRMGIQAFQPVLIEGNAIKIHPLVCTGFNADFDGDQMAVHLPLSWEAQIEAKTLMLSTNNIFSPAHGGPLIAPTQDIVLGCYYLSVERDGRKGEGKHFRDTAEAVLAYSNGVIDIHAPIYVRLGKDRAIRTESEDVVLGERDALKTTIGRILFNDVLPKGMPFYNVELTKKELSRVIQDSKDLLGREATLLTLDAMKDVGFKAATRAGLSFCKDDMQIPGDKVKILADTEKDVARKEKACQEGIITDNERYRGIIELWTHAREKLGQSMLRGFKGDSRFGADYLNPIHLMTSSGARGSIDQVRQLAGMRGLMAKPSGEIIETPIKANFREGLNVLEFFSSTHGARKGLADTALKTADSGYLTRKLADVAQNVVINENDCGTTRGIAKGPIFQGRKQVVSLADNIVGRTARMNIVDPVTDEIIVKENELITAGIARRIEGMNFPRVRVRSPLTCETQLGVCARCYGMDLSAGALGEEGLAVGIIGAQSIGEPGTQLTMRTFHIGGVAGGLTEARDIHAKEEGKIKYANLHVVTNKQGIDIVLNRNGEVVILDVKNRPIDRHGVPAGAELRVKEGDTVKPQDIILVWDPNNIPILAERGGVVRFEEVVEGVTVSEMVDRGSSVRRRVIIESKGALHPQIIIEDKKSGEKLAFYPLPEKTYLECGEGDKVTAGTLLAKTPRAITGVQDITGGLPRVTELFEARKPKTPAVLSKIDGKVAKIEKKKRGKISIYIKNENVPDPEEHLVPPGRNMRVHVGDEVKSGDQLVDGPLVPQDILDISGEEAVQEYLLNEIQSVYLAQNQTINDKHIEIIISQMMRKVRITDPGDTDLLPETLIDKWRFKEGNDEAVRSKRKPATAVPVLMGITKASLQSDSFISAASFQETTKVLTQAALAGKKDELLGLKENVILGHLIPAGTGFKGYYSSMVKKMAPLDDEDYDFGEDRRKSDAPSLASLL